MKKTCFLITPIGKPNSLIRKRVDQWEHLVYEPAFGEEFRVIRADKIAAPGIITEQILDLIVHAELAIIDFTDLNANVMYEAAIRHASRKQFIQICPTATDLPFDIQHWRVNYYDPEDLEYPQKLMEKLKACYKEMQEPDYTVPELLPVKFI